jgi:hypothetical protein
MIHVRAHVGDSNRVYANCLHGLSRFAATRASSRIAAGRTALGSRSSISTAKTSSNAAVANGKAHTEAHAVAETACAEARKSRPGSATRHSRRSIEPSPAPATTVAKQNPAAEASRLATTAIA